VAVPTRVVMFGELLDESLSKTKILELPTFRPDRSLVYEIGRHDQNVQDEEKICPFKLFIEETSISRNHLKISFALDQGWVVTEHGSTYGTLIATTEISQISNSEERVPLTTALQPQSPRVLRVGDELRLSTSAFLTVVYCKFTKD
jgi:pSer/pThr/pTyr-binding forkhead associated (FHA) protein